MGVDIFPPLITPKIHRYRAYISTKAQQTKEYIVGQFERVSRGLPRLRVLRRLMEEVDRLFDRRCRTATAIAKLVASRGRLRRSARLQALLKKLLSPELEKVLVFLDERLMGATSNSGERGNRRYRKMQKTVYRVRTRRAIEGRPALDLLRESQAHGRDGTTQTLHEARAA